ncbi:unnamed protein product [Prorocentrum cordatum]|uniref:Uncharacterized protein n=1 Tax=Prorocentrum cordatum TaxID=2364126 RepID=A0ABN9UC25_9DINO|nr:unnamed protein product [Polarella glacialis]
MTNPAPPLPTSLPAAPSRGPANMMRAGTDASMARKSSAETGSYDVVSRVASLAGGSPMSGTQMARVHTVANIVRNKQELWRSACAGRRLAGSTSKKLKPSQIKKVYRRFQEPAALIYESENA